MGVCVTESISKTYLFYEIKNHPLRQIISHYKKLIAKSVIITDR